MSFASQELGREGERIAEEWLVQQGWRVIDRRYRSGHRDIDLVMERRLDCERVIAFVEVKCRATGDFGGPLGAVHWRKQREMARAARDWIAREKRFADSYRFDVVGIVCGEAVPTVVHVENAFRVR
jgi:putative endonuclease